ncbi:MAG: gamma-glutamyl-gamma-aminobutyrate hydrolase family protein [Eubacteriales bacterium]|nr:gamma-glutamyl-gamma-aminobutyrate hydrolase family protein [Eubacteriales bacterium]
MDRPIIGIPGAHMLNTAGALPVQTDYVNRSYCRCIERAGGIPLLIPEPDTEETEGLRKALSLCQGLLFPGGIDVDPALYHEDPVPMLGTVDIHMDRFWINAVQIAAELSLPLLGICRGLQLVNVALGGSLYQDLSLKTGEHLLHSQRQNRDYLIHKVTITEGSRLSELLGTDQIYTNSMHHQCVKQPGEGLFITAGTSDGIPEAMESADGRIMLVQWHPEELWDSEPRMRRLFEDLIERAKRGACSGE